MAPEERERLRAERQQAADRVKESETAALAAQRDAEAAQVELAAAVERLGSLADTLDLAEQRLAEMDARIEALTLALRMRDDELLSSRAEQEALRSAHGSAQVAITILRQRLEGSDGERVASASGGSAAVGEPVVDGE